MKKSNVILLMCLVWFCSLTNIAQVIPNNEIRYKAKAKLLVTKEKDIPGIRTTAFDVSIKEHTFLNGTGVIKFNGNVNYIGNGAFVNCNNLTDLSLPNSVTYIGINAFYGCTSLTNIEIPISVIYIGNFAFADCTSLTNIKIPNSVTDIGSFAFWDCTSLTNIEIPNSVTNIGDCAFEDCTSLTKIEIPNSVTDIGGSAFHGCTSLTKIEIPNSVTNIGESAFYGCTSLTKIEIPNSVTNIGESAFCRCTSLKEVTIPNSVKRIEKDAFWGCESLKKVIIPYSVNFIGENAFYGSGKLRREDGKKVHIKRNNDDVLENLGGLLQISGQVASMILTGNTSHPSGIVSNNAPLLSMSNSQFTARNQQELNALMVKSGNDVNAQYWNEYQQFAMYNKKTDGSSYSFDEWMSLQGQAIQNLKKEGYDVLAENQKIIDQQKADFEAERKADKEELFNKMGYNTSSATSNTSSSKESVKDKIKSDKRKVENSTNENLNSKQQFHIESVSSDDYQYEKKVTLYIRDANNNRVMFTNKDLCKKGASYYVKLDNTYYKVESGSNWGFNSYIMFASTKLMFNK